jgi:hypothetical protein
MSAVSSSVSTGYQVFLGFWIDWSRGRIAGATITLTKSNGGLLIAFIAIFVGAAGRSFWRLLCFAIHRWLSVSSPQDAVYHQRQVILRNSNTAQDAAWTMTSAIFAWRNKASRPYRRLLPLIALALIVSIAFGIAGVFSSSITSNGDEVLVLANNCGPIDSSDSTLPTQYYTDFLPWQFARVTTFNNYALSCAANSSILEACNSIYVRPNLPSIINRNASCPFDSKMCKTQNQNLIVDTGYLDSHYDLGINAPPEQRFQLRLFQQCAPLVTEGFTETVDSPMGKLARYYYGNLLGYNSTFTYQMPLNWSLSNMDNYTYRGSARPDYALG